MTFPRWFKESSGRRPDRRRRVSVDAVPEILERRSLLSTITVSINSMNAALEAPTLDSPGSTAAPGPVLTTLTPTFTWQAESGATSYLINIHNITTNTYFTQTTTGGSTTSYTVPTGTLGAGDQYNWHLYADSSSTGSQPSALLYFQTLAAPATPTLDSPGSSTSPGPILTTLTPTFTWQDVSGATSYLINIHNITTNTYFTPTITGGSTTSYTVPAGTLAAGDLYNWHLYAENASGTSQPSALLYFQTQVATPTAPILVSPGSSMAPGPILTTLTPTFTWKAVSGATSYLINIDNVTTSTHFTQTITGGSTTSYTVPTGPLAAGNQYNWQLNAQNAGGSSSSALLYFQTQVAAPATPIVVSPGSSTAPGPILTTLTPTLTWQSVSGATSYLINIHNITTNTYFTPTITGGSTTSYTVPAGTLAAGDQYSWHLYAQNPGGSSMSILLYFQTQAVTPAPPIVVSPGSTAAPGPVLTTLIPTFTWQAVSGATSYLINIHNTTTNTYFTQTITGGTTTSFTVPAGTLAGGDQYSWHVYSQSASATAGMSALLYFQTQAVTLAPPILVSPGSSMSPGSKLTTLMPTFTWQPVSGATSYLINIHNITTNTYYTQTISGGATTSFTVPAGVLVAGDQYSWHLYSLSTSATAGMSAVMYFQT